MHLDQLVHFIEQYGYFALFFSLWLGIIGAPIPDEVIVMTGGLVSSFHVLRTVPAFIVTYLGVISGLSLGYLLGRLIGAPVLHWLERKKKMAAYIEKSKILIQKYGSFALIIGYFFPFVRHLVPYLVGINKMSFIRYASFSFATGFVWTMLYFTLGRLFGNHIEQIGYTLYRYGWIMIAVFIVILGLWISITYHKKAIR